jgi:hypothetical protein
MFTTERNFSTIQLSQAVYEFMAVVSIQIDINHSDSAFERISETGLDGWNARTLWKEG